MAVGTEHSFSITFGTSGGTYRLQNVDGMREVSDVIETTHHGTTGHRTKIRGDLLDSQPFTVQVQFEGTVGLPSLSAAPELITITMPKALGESAGATIAGTGFVSERQWPGGAAGGTGLKMGEMTIVFNGGEGGGSAPAFTEATTT